MTAPVPDLKPHVPPLAPGSECCGCCDGLVIGETNEKTRTGNQGS